MDIGTWIDAVIAVLACAGTLVAVWAVLLSERNTKALYAVNRNDVVASCIQQFAETVSEYKAIVLPICGFSADDHVAIGRHYAGELTGAQDEDAAEKARVMSATVTEMHVRIEALTIHGYRIMHAIQSLPSPVREAHRDIAQRQIAWVEASVMVHYLSLVDEKLRTLWTGPGALADLLDYLPYQYKGEDSAERVAKVEEDNSPDVGDGTNVAFGMIAGGVAGLWNIGLEISEHLETTRAGVRNLVSS